MNVLRDMQDKNEFKVIIVPGIYTTVGKINEITEFLKNELYYAGYDFDIEVKNLENYLNRNSYSIEFAFDTRCGKFIRPNYNKICYRKKE